MFDKLISLLQGLGTAVLPFQVVSEDCVAILLRFGRYRRDLAPGLIWKLPLADRIMTCDARVHFYTTNAHSLITRDGSPVVLSALMSFRAAQPRQAILGAQTFGQSVWDGTAATLAALVMEIEFEALATDEFSARLLERVKAENAPYGVDVLTCRLNDVAKARTYRVLK